RWRGLYQALTLAGLAWLPKWWASIAAMMRQIGKQILTIAAWLALTLGVAAQSSEPSYVTDPLTGVAIDGYDAVTYFILAEPQPGKPDFEYVWSGVSWY